MNRRGSSLFTWLLVLLILLVSGCFPSREAPENHRRILESPSGNYTLEMNIEEQGITPEYQGTQVWMVHLYDTQNQLVYVDRESIFVAALMVYWVWDAQDRLWLYNSDTGRVYYWEQEDRHWTKNFWGTKRTPQVFGEVSPPEILYPSYVE